MMRIPTSSNKKTPYLFRTGVSTEFHNFSPFNTAQGAFFETELGRGFSFGFSAVIPGDTTIISKLKESTYNPPAEFGFHFQQRVYMYNDISISIGLQDVVFQNDQTSDQILSLNTQLLSFFVVLGSEKSLGDYNMNTYMGFGTGGLAPMDTLELDPDSVTNNSGVFLGFVFKTPFFQGARILKAFTNLERSKVFEKKRETLFLFRGPDSTSFYQSCTLFGNSV